MTEKIYTRNDPCPFTEGEEIWVTDIGGKLIIEMGYKREFYGFDKTLSKPFIVKSNGIICNYTFAKKIHPDLEVDAKVWVRDDHSDDWIEAHFAKWGADGGIRTYIGGKTSHTESGYHNWNYYTLEDPSKHDCCKE